MKSGRGKEERKEKDWGRKEGKGKTNGRLMEGGRK